MIAPHWRGWTRLADASEPLADTVMPGEAANCGYQRGYVLRGDGAEDDVTSGLRSPGSPSSDADQFLLNASGDAGRLGCGHHVHFAANSVLGQVDARLH